MAIWGLDLGCHCQLSDPNMNDKDHLVGLLTRGSMLLLRTDVISKSGFVDPL